MILPGDCSSALTPLLGDVKASSWKNLGYLSQKGLFWSKWRQETKRESSWVIWKTA